ncbi:MAG: hypothetical protein DLM72_00100 [Candidatus Nitrosopolaris wilkensis]|nr:MAG: hypothetical protein DLM72_00100 [Candidatus Nitrosopolaris wilkensis]
MVSAKKVMVIGLMAVLGSSVLVGAVSLYNRSSSNAPATTIGLNQSELNARLNSILDFCLNSLPNGIQACDRQLKNVVTDVCTANNGRLDACHNGKVDQYYVARAAGVRKSAINKTQ